MIRLIFKILALMSCLIFCHITLASQDISDHLVKSTGNYGVSFKDFHWVNNNICPDPNFTEKNKKDFSSDNKKYCHELMIRFYYPTLLKTSDGVPYYRPLINTEQSVLRAKPAVKAEDIKKLSEIKSHTVENAPIVKNVQFPVIFFMSGLGGIAQMYENLITELVSHGYIVIGINSTLISGDIALPDNRIVSMIDPQNWDQVNKKTIPVMEQDIAFVYRKIHNANLDALFKSMDLKHIGILGHSFGGRATANITNQYKKWFQALATLDMEVHMGSFESTNPTMPSMHIISAYWKSAFAWQSLHYQLNKNSYLVTLSPQKNDIHYSYHMNFTDLSTLQYMSAYQDSMAYDRTRLEAGEDVLIQNQGEKLTLTKINQPLYLLVNNKNSWAVYYYEPGKKSTIIDLENIPALKVALDSFPESPTESTLTAIKKIIHAHHQGFGNFLGKGNGVQITKAINRYLVDFFNTFLKNDKKNPFKACAPLTNDTRIECGPGLF